MAVEAHLLVPDHDAPDQLAAASALSQSLFTDGLAFLSATTYEDAFGGSLSRLEVPEGPDCAAHVATLGLGVFARGVRRGHDAFGRAAGFTVALAEAGDVDASLEAHRKQTKRYLGQVMGWRDRGEDTAGISEALLQPWVTWSPDPAGSAAVEEDDEEPEAEEQAAAGVGGPEEEELEEVDLDENLGPDLRPERPDLRPERPGARRPDAAE